MEKINFMNTITEAIKEKDISKLENIIFSDKNNKIKDILNEPIDYGNSIFHYLVCDDYFLKITKMLFAKYKNKININMQNKNGNSLLHLATMNKSKETIKFLIGQKNIDMNIENKENKTAFICAIEDFTQGKDSPDIALLLLKNDYDFGLVYISSTVNEYKYFLDPAIYCKIASIAVEENCIDVLIKKLTVLCKNNYDKLLELLDKPIKDGKKLIHLLAEIGNLEAIKDLSNIYKNINTKGNCGFTPLQLAVMNGQEDVVKFLLEQENINIYVKDKNGFRLPVYVEFFDVEPKIEELIKEYDKNIKNKTIDKIVDLNDEEKQYYSNPLNYYNIVNEAVINNDIEAIEKLFEAYRDNDGKLIDLLNELVVDNKKLFQLAAEYGRLDILKILINKCFCINTTGKCNLTALELATINGHTEVVKFLLNQKDISFEKKNDNTTVFHFAAQYGRLDILNILLNKYGTDKINLINYSGKTPLFLAIENGHIEVVKFLIRQKNIDINAKDYNGFDILYYAIKNGNKDLIKTVLTELIKKLNKKNINEKTLIHYVVKNGYIDILKLLLSMPSIDINVTDKMGRTPLDIAIKNKNIEAVELLIKRSNGLKFFNEKNQRFTSVFTTIKNKTPNILKFITNYKDKENYNLNEKLGDDGVTPLHYAVANKNYEAVKILLKNGADINSKTTLSNNTPLNFAIINEDYKMVRLLFKYIEKQIKNQVENFNKLEEKLKKQQKRIKNLLDKVNNTKWRWLEEKREIKLAEELKILINLENEEKIQAENIKNRIGLSNFSKKDIDYFEKNRILTPSLKDLYKISKEIDNKTLQSNKVIF